MPLKYAHLTVDITSPDAGKIALKGEMVIIEMTPDENGYMAHTIDDRVSFYLDVSEFELD
jgi:hypothetical protein